MSKQAVLEMFERVEHDTDLRQALFTTLSEPEEEARKDFLKVASEAGFEFSAGDLAAAAKDLLPEGGAELDGKELDSVVGGVSYLTSNTLSLYSLAVQTIVPRWPSAGIVQP